MRGVPHQTEHLWGKATMAYKKAKRGMITVSLLFLFISSPLLIAYGNRILARISIPNVVITRVRENRSCLREHASYTFGAQSYLKKKHPPLYDPWKISDMIAVGVIAHGRTTSTLFMPSSLYSLYMSSEKYGERLSAELKKKLVDTVFLGDMFVALSKEGGECVIVPYLAGQFKLRYVSPQIMVFPDGAMHARGTWNTASKELLFPGSPFSPLSLMWP
jgi:hypothetical protein